MTNPTAWLPTWHCCNMPGVRLSMKELAHSSAYTKDNADNYHNCVAKANRKPTGNAHHNGFAFCLAKTANPPEPTARRPPPIFDTKTPPVYDSKVFPYVAGDISLNAIIATLSTVSKSSLIFSVSAILGQLKWDWYEWKPRRLDHLETFDEASRSPLGATKLLLGKTAFSIASIGATIIILALAVDPFVQQVVGTAQLGRYVSSDEVWTERQTRPAYFSRGENPDREYFDALNSAIWNDAAIYDRRAHCPSGNCQFESFETLEFCVDSEIITDLTALKVNCSAGFESKEFEGLVKNWNETKSLASIETNDGCKIWFQDDADVSDYLASTIKISLSSPFGLSYTSSTELYTINFPGFIIGRMNLQQNPTGRHIKPRIKLRDSLITMGAVRFSTAPESRGYLDVKLESAEWAVLTLCKTRWSVSVVNGSTTSVSTSKKFGRVYTNTSAHPDLLCWSPDADEPGNSPRTPVTQTPNGVDLVANSTTMDFCASNLYWGEDVQERLSSVYRDSKTTYRTHSSRGWVLMGDGRGNGRSTTHRALEGDIFTSEDIHKRVQNKTLGAVMQSIAAALNNFSLALTQEEHVWGSVRISETVVARASG
ncbi:hypothetical protein B0H67DRAFT_608176 [Lasiosphaeris hirsuta]|uniref:Uncharacterized protein n=1 Tax=Lasiosphaeris hirsuta TaxID=260670 RepID=A0AA40DZW5_9PEZI|nr:hypothetical protein B0H67DRAFT_608176 [Lasiosphaeris hirsuta]